jgi:hypothetical protein
VIFIHKRAVSHIVCDFPHPSHSGETAVPNKDISVGCLLVSPVLVSHHVFFNMSIYFLVLFL